MCREHGHRMAGVVRGMLCFAILLTYPPVSDLPSRPVGVWLVPTDAARQ